MYECEGPVTVSGVSDARAVARGEHTPTPYGLERVVADLFDALCKLVAEARAPDSDTNACADSIVKCVTALAVLVGPDEAERDYEIAQARASS